MANTNPTRKDLFTRIAMVMADDAEVVEMCDKYIAQLSKPRTKKEKPEDIEFRSKVLSVLTNAEAPMTSTEIAEVLGEGVTFQKVGPAVRALIEEELAERVEPEKKSGKATFKAL